VRQNNPFHQKQTGKDPVSFDQHMLRLRQPSMSEVSTILDEMESMLITTGESLAELYKAEREVIYNGLYPDAQGKRPFCTLSLRFREVGVYHYLEWSRIFPAGRGNEGTRWKRRYLAKRRNSFDYNPTVLLAEAPAEYHTLIIRTEVAARPVRAGFSLMRAMREDLRSITSAGLGDLARAISLEAQVSATLASVVRKTASK
jgi:hypothetical protein